MNNLFLLLVLFVGFVYLKKSKKSFWIQIALLLVVCLLASDMIEGVENPAESVKQRGCGEGVKTFYAYFGRESAESAESGNRLYNRPPFYKPSNIDFADLKGELEFLICNNSKKGKIKKVKLSLNKNNCIIIKPNNWFSFRSISREKEAIFLNLTDGFHSSRELLKKPIYKFKNPVINEI